MPTCEDTRPRTLERAWQLTGAAVSVHDREAGSEEAHLKIPGDAGVYIARMKPGTSAHTGCKYELGRVLCCVLNRGLRSEHRQRIEINAGNKCDITQPELGNGAGVPRCSLPFRPDHEKRSHGLRFHCYLSILQ